MYVGHTRQRISAFNAGHVSLAARKQPREGNLHRRACTRLNLVLTPEQIDNMRIVMVRTRNPLNVGAVARAMSNFGFLNLRMVQPYDAAFREARSAVDAEQVLAAAAEFEDVARAVADCSLVVGTTGGGARHTLEPIQRLETAATIIRQHLQSGEKVAMLFGSEKVGCPMTTSTTAKYFSASPLAPNISR